MGRAMHYHPSPPGKSWKVAKKSLQRALVSVRCAELSAEREGLELRVSGERSGARVQSSELGCRVQVGECRAQSSGFQGCREWLKVAVVRVVEG
eukprot:1326180-Rhodomonas_salina.3